ncbi:uncharacterized protein MYCGRDRAFT_107818 [Zymoseptoria tritici IPO323]|uniref:Uncharacterized protein n=1 Tax=Zymoseptoria tritici (strain CBS 115943 / IPO323) TaxID=336722 RepID=F9X201_ZYMTI|nr:uncharacterized protein MYCGRDRAFT_107818 [Zymoseptoria tritici IPO323]EGP89687.1 hypothetical protein MYCGRDRAFT_107818 [Zymoseptoria tritici IPO323]
MSTYFTLPSFARAKKHQDELEKSNPQEPVLKEEDEKFLERHLSIDESAGAATNAATSAPKPKKEKEKTLDLPSQEEAEAATRSWNAQNTSSGGTDTGDHKRTWASYIPAALVPSKGDSSKQAEEKQSSEGETGQKQTWAMYASQYVPSSATTLPSLPAMPAIPALSSWYRSKDKDATPELVYKEDGTVDEAATKEKQEKEVSVLLDNLNMSSINNRVFALSGETHKIYERFALVLKDTIEGGPTAYEDMEKLMKDAGPTLEKQFQSMPPFVQTLVKSLPAKMGLGLAPEFLATLSGDKPDDHLKAQGATASASTVSTDEKEKKKKKRKIPGLKKLVSQQGAVATMLRNTVSFITTRFPFLASTTNVVMSLSVFILMFVFWYCHKRGKEARLARTNESLDGGGKVEGEVDDAEDDDDVEAESTDDEISTAQEKAGEVASEAPVDKETEKETEKVV